MSAQVMLRDEQLKCRCGGTTFTSHYRHNPYGHDAGQHVHGCDACGTEYVSGYYGTKFLPVIRVSEETER